MGIGKVIKGGASAGLRFGSFLRLFFIFLFIFLITLNVIIIAIKERSTEPIIKDLGYRVLEPVVLLKQDADKIIENKGVYDGSRGRFMGFFGVLGIYTNLFSSLLSIIVWIIFFMSLMSWLPISGDSSKKFTNFFLAIGLVYVLQVSYLAYVNWNADVSFIGITMTPFKAIGSFFNSLPYILSPISGSLGLDNVQNVTIEKTSNFTGNHTVNSS